MTKNRLGIPILYYIVSYRIVSYRIISYHIVSYHIISYHIISSHLISYHIIYHIINHTGPLNKHLNLNYRKTTTKQSQVCLNSRSSRIERKWKKKEKGKACSRIRAEGHEEKHEGPLLPRIRLHFHFHVYQALSGLSQDMRYTL